MQDWDYRILIVISVVLYKRLLQVNEEMSRSSFSLRGLEVGLPAF